MKKTARSDFGLTVVPSTYVSEGFRRRGLTNEELAVRCEEIKSDILRHADNVAGVRITFTSKEVCSFCGLEWCEITQENITGPAAHFYDEHSIPGEPGCCDEAIAEFRAKRNIPQA
jgi:hypothetical protein